MNRAPLPTYTVYVMLLLAADQLDRLLLSPLRLSTPHFQINHQPLANLLSAGRPIMNNPVQADDLVPSCPHNPASPRRVLSFWTGGR